MEPFTIMTVREYNNQQTAKYHRDCQAHDSSKGGFPQIAFYLFFDNFGNERKKGFVLKTKTGAKCFKTKKEAVAEKQKLFEKEYREII
jgi:hypothetical protein